MASPDTGTSTVARPGPAATRTTGSNPFNAAVPMILLVGLVALPAILGPQIASGFFDVLDSLAATTPAIVASGYRGIGGAGAGAGAGNATAAAGGAVSGVSGGVDQWIAPVAARKHFVPPWLPFAAAVREGIDAWLTGLVAFFWVTVRSGDARLSLFAAYMAGQLVPGHAAVMLEGMRHGNEGRWISL